MVMVYTKPGCTQCNATYSTLDKKGVEFEAVDVTKDPSALEVVRNLGYMQMPVVVTDNGHWSGFRPDRIEEIEQ